MSKTKEFLDLYRNIEELLSVRYKGKRVKYSNVIMEYAYEDEGRRWDEELNLCREIRNLLSHHADIDGESPIEPSEGMIKILRQVVDYLEYPPASMDYATPVSSLMIVSLNDSVLDVIERMDARGFSHVPVVRNKRLYGVFSISTFFQFMRDNKSFQADEKSKIDSFRAYLPVSLHKTEQFVFVEKNASYDELRRKFSAKGPDTPRIAALFVTQNGRADEVLLGMITPWDMIRRLEI